jgi:hypothetical protein
LERYEFEAFVEIDIFIIFNFHLFLFHSCKWFVGRSDSRSSSQKNTRGKILDETLADTTKQKKTLVSTLASLIFSFAQRLPLTYTEMPNYAILLDQNPCNNCRNVRKHAWRTADWTIEIMVILFFPDFYASPLFILFYLFFAFLQRIELFYFIINYQICFLVEIPKSVRRLFPSARYLECTKRRKNFSNFFLLSASS